METIHPIEKLVGTTGHTVETTLFLLRCGDPAVRMGPDGVIVIFVHKGPVVLAQEGILEFAILPSNSMACLPNGAIWIFLNSTSSEVTFTLTQLTISRVRSIPSEDSLIRRLSIFSDLGSLLLQKPPPPKNVLRLDRSKGGPMTWHLSMMFLDYQSYMTSDERVTILMWVVSGYLSATSRRQTMSVGVGKCFGMLAGSNWKVECPIRAGTILFVLRIEQTAESY